VTSKAPDAGWLNDLVQRVNGRLEQLFRDRRNEVRSLSPEGELLVDAVEGLTMRGGKRLRPAVLFAGYRAVARGGDVTRTLELGAAIELLQTYFLIQDDWMDGDEERRGGPSVHIALGARCGEVLGASLAILASDLASGFAWELCAAAPFPAQRLREGLIEFGRMHGEVVYGQQLDLQHHDDVARVHQLKTGSYTVRGPLRLGAVLGDASAEQIAALERFGAPLGLAFQLRDDLLGVFGDRAQTGKPVGNDLRAGKRSALVAEARRLLSADDRALLDWSLGNPEANDDTVARALELIVRSGARERVEARLRELLAEAQAALQTNVLEAQGAAMLHELSEQLAQRAR
jgi:geranylgeranyl diphosphate synthase type I